MTDLAARVSDLEAQSERALRTLGDLAKEIAGTTTPQRVGDTLVPWPFRALGRVRLVRREGTVLFVTDGLSHPFDPSVHGEGHEALGFELGMEVPIEEVGDTPAKQAGSWVVPALLWLGSCYVMDQFRLLDLVDHFGMVTQILPPERALAHLLLTDGSVGALAGMPLAPTTTFGREAQHLLWQASGEEARLVMLTALTPDECTWVRSVDDGSRAMDLARALWARGHGHRTLPHRQSLLRLERPTQGGEGEAP
jgi:hypothetical protein